MLHVIVNQFFLGIRDRRLDGMKLLGKIKTGPPRLDHLDRGPKVPFGALQALADSDVTLMLFHEPYTILPYRMVQACRATSTATL